MDVTTIAVLLAGGVIMALSFRNQAPPRATRDDLARWRHLAETCELQDISVTGR